MDGEIELWKNVQGKEIKKKNSEIINIIILNFNIIFKQNVRFPKNVLSRIMSRNHKVLIKITFENIERNGRKLLKEKFVRGYRRWILYFRFDTWISRSKSFFYIV